MKWSRAVHAVAGATMFVASLALLTGCPTGWRLVRVEGEKPSVHPELWSEVRKIRRRVVKEAAKDAACKRYIAPLFHCEQDPGYCMRTPPFEGVPAREKNLIPLKSKTDVRSLVSLVHMSDAQLKEHRITMEGALSARAYDGLTNGALRNGKLERHDDAGLLATVIAINEMKDIATSHAEAFAPLAPPQPPSFVVHGGDAVDVGVFSELVQFMAVMGELEVPFFNVVGNHDNLFFGTFPFEHMKGKNVLLPYVPLYDTDRFMRFHSPAGADADISVPSFEARGDPHRASKDGRAYEPEVGIPDFSSLGRDAPMTNFHGFDLACHKGVSGSAALCPEARGYYSFEKPLAADTAGGARVLRVIVLNTAEIVPESVGSGFNRRSRANLQPEQIRWLEDELVRPSKAGTVFTLVVGHHNLDSFLHDDQARGVKKLMLRAPRLLAYLTGHTHKDDMVVHQRCDGSVLWEIVAGSTLVYPQFARLVEVLEQVSSGDLFLRIASFRQQLSDGAGVIDPKSESCYALARRARWAREGAFEDNDDDKVEDAVAVPKANGLLRVWAANAKPRTCR